MTQNQQWKVSAKICVGPPKGRNFIVGVMHELRVPNESKCKDENKRGDKCDEESCPVHNFPIEVLLGPKKTLNFHCEIRAGLSIQI
jgi:hypothetical protein